MKTFLRLFLLISASTFLTVDQGLGQSSSIQINASEKERAITSLLQTAASLNEIVSNTIAPKTIKLTLDSVLYSPLLKQSQEPNWSQKRASGASAIVSNLALIEIALHKTGFVTNAYVSYIKLPNEINFLPEGSSTSLKKISDPKTRELLLAYRAVLKAQGEIWNLYQSLQAEHSFYKQKSFNLVAEAYARPPAAPDEINKLLEPYAGYEFVPQITAAIEARKNKPPPVKFVPKPKVPPPLPDPPAFTKELKYWLGDVPTAQTIARKENKRVLLIFTSSDGATNYMRCQQEVFAQREFIEYANQNLVLVEVDFPRQKPQTATRKMANRELKELYGVLNYPTFVLLDSEGKMTGMKSGYTMATPYTFITTLERMKSGYGLAAAPRPAPRPPATAAPPVQK